MQALGALLHLLTIFVSVLLSCLFAVIVNSFGSALYHARQGNEQTTNDFFVYYLMPMMSVAFCSVLLNTGSSKSFSSARHLYSITSALKGYLLQPSAKTGDMLANVASAAVNLAAGVSLGRFGPCVTLGAAVGNSVGLYFNVDVPDLLLSLRCAATAAAIATCMASPLTAIVYLFETLKDSSHSRFCWILAAAILGYYGGRRAHLGIPFSSSPEAHQPWVISFFPDCVCAICIGIFSYLGYVMFSGLHVRVHQLLHAMASRLAIRPSVLPLVITLILICIYWGSPYAAGTSDAIVKHILNNSAQRNLLAEIVVTKLLATILCITAGFQGGIVGPCLVVGSCSSMLCYLLFTAYFPMAIDPHIIAAAGAAGTIASTTKLPLFAVIISCEILGAFHGIVFVLLATFVAYSLSGGPQSETIAAASSSDADHVTV